MAILVLHGDGSVRTVSESTETDIVVELITRAGGTDRSAPHGY
jgi:hypothetical protein